MITLVAAGDVEWSGTTFDPGERFGEFLFNS